MADSLEAIGRDYAINFRRGTMTQPEALREALAALASVKVALDMQSRGRNSAIIDTLWFDGTETLFDYIDRKIEEVAALEAQGVSGAPEPAVGSSEPSASGGAVQRPVDEMLVKRADLRNLVAHVWGIHHEQEITAERADWLIDHCIGGEK